MDWSAIFFQGWADIGRTLVVGVLAYVTLVVFLRISGKRTLAKLNAFDLVVTVALGSILASILLTEAVSLSEGATALAVLIGLQALVTFVSVRSAGFADLVRSEPSLLVHQGKYSMGTMKQERITRDEVLSAIRSSGGHDVTDAQTVVLESDGSLSVSLDGSGDSKSAGP
ncbi:hypothetical protein A7A08_01021 [Methyloligella halotolerans]|uniref:DUF421 domain-containing protein n=1 Tax=Methyloligella halotolerans TaxID=1177755 RepID=A0A1E2S055_9HYPH|nr:YetF domain-containing protein [Methyloligella halotolerans]ODA67854.1 hypothetical protein A7A08_01021 [Methyloligella halotolerans]